MQSRNMFNRFASSAHYISGSPLAVGATCCACPLRRQPSSRSAASSLLLARRYGATDTLPTASPQVMSNFSVTESG